MVKFAEAEKRRGGDGGGDRRIAPVLLLERPKISRGMWESLKSRILKERRKKKEEIEADEKEKKVRKERENQKKRQAMTLEETREQIEKEKEKLANCQAQKHSLVQQLKKVLHEESQRREQEKKQEEQQHQQQQQQLQFQHQQHAQAQNFVKDSDLVSVHPYGHGSLSLSGHSQMMFPGSIVPGRPSNIPLYKMGGPTSQPLQSQAAIKRSRSPSPPAQNYQQMPYVFKSLPGSQTSVVPVSIPSTKPVGTGSSVYLNSQPGTYYHNSNQPHVSSGQFQPVSAAHVTALHSLDHKKAPLSSRSNTSFPPHPENNQDKFYARPHLVLHSGGIIPVQQSPSGNKGPPLSGFPARVPTSHPSSTSHSFSAHSIPRTYF